MTPAQLTARGRPAVPGDCAPWWVPSPTIERVTIVLLTSGLVERVRFRLGAHLDRWAVEARAKPSVSDKGGGLEMQIQIQPDA